MEFTEWQAYFELEPFGEAVADLRHGVATAVLANVNRSAEARPEPYRPSDFIHWGGQAGQGAATSPADNEPVLLDDPVAHAQLMRAAIFGKTPA